MKQYRHTMAYFILQGALFGMNAVLIGFTGNFLYDFAFQDHHISLFMGLTTALACVLQLGAAEVISRSKRVTVYQVLMGAGILSLVSSVAMWRGWTGWIPVFGLGLISTMVLAGPSLVNSMGVEAIDRGSPTNFGVGRGGGSLVYTLMALATGQLVARFGSGVLALLGAALSGLLLFAAAWYHRLCSTLPYHPAAEVGEGRKQASRGNFLASYPHFSGLLLGSALLFISHNLICVFMLQITLAKGGGAAEQGIAAAIGAVGEIPVMFGFSRMLKRVSCGRWLCLSSLFFLVKTIVIYFATGCIGVYAGQATQMMGFPIFLMASVEYAKQTIGPVDTVRAQSYLSSTCTIGGLIASASGGFLCQMLGVNAMILTAAAAAGLGAIVVTAVVWYDNRKKSTV